MQVGANYQPRRFVPCQRNSSRELAHQKMLVPRLMLVMLVQLTIDFQFITGMPMTDDDQDIRWQQRFANYRKALTQLQKFIDKGDMSELEKLGLIKAFEYTYELAWNTMKDFLEYRGQADLYGSRDVIRKAFELELVEDGDNWMDMLKSRNQTSHTYNQETADEICRAIHDRYYRLFVRLEEKLAGLHSGQG